jgi:hypothetical protein
LGLIPITEEPDKGRDGINIYSLITRKIIMISQAPHIEHAGSAWLRRLILFEATL